MYKRQVYNVLGQARWPWMTPRTIGSVAHVQYRASWRKHFGVLESPGIFSKEESGNLVNRKCVFVVIKIFKKIMAMFLDNRW